MANQTTPVSNVPFPDDSFFTMKEDSDASTVSSTPANSPETPDRSVVEMKDASMRSAKSEASSSYIPPEAQPAIATTTRKSKKDKKSKLRRELSAEEIEERDRPKFMDRKSFLEKQVSEQFSIMKLLDPSSFHDANAATRSQRKKSPTATAASSSAAIASPLQGSTASFPSVFQKDVAEKKEKPLELLDEVNQMLATLPKKQEDDEQETEEPVESAQLESSARDRKKKPKKKEKSKKHKKKKEKKERRPSSSRLPGDRSSQDLATSAAAAAAAIVPLSDDQKRPEVDVDDRPSLPKLATKSTSALNPTNPGQAPSPATAHNRAKLSSSLIQVTRSIQKKEDERLALRKSSVSRREEIKRLQQVTQSERRKEKKSSSRKSSSGTRSHRRSNGTSRGTSKSSSSKAASKLLAQSMPDINARTVDRSEAKDKDQSWMAESSLSKSQELRSRTFVNVKKTKVKDLSEFDSTDGFSDDDDHSVMFALQTPAARKLSRHDDNFSEKRSPRKTAREGVDAAWDSSVKDMFSGKKKAPPGEESSVRSLRVEDLVSETRSVASQGNASQGNASQSSYGTTKSESSKYFRSAPALGHDWNTDLFAARAPSNFLSPQNGKKKPPLLPKGARSSTSNNGSSLSLPFAKSSAQNRRSSAGSIASSCSSATGMSRSTMTSAYTADQASYMASSILTGDQSVMTSVTAEHSMLNESMSASRSSKFSETGRSYAANSTHSGTSCFFEPQFDDGLKGILKPPSPTTVPSQPMRRKSKSTSNVVGPSAGASGGNSVTSTSMHSTSMHSVSSSGDAIRRSVPKYSSSKMRRRTTGHLSSDAAAEESPAATKRGFLGRAKKRLTGRKSRQEM